MASGICGWIQACRAPADGAPPGPERGDAAKVMAGALAHRGEIACLAAGGVDGEGALQVAADSAFNTRAEILSAWRESGGDAPAFASRLRGSFAVALLDPSTGTLVLARDRLGEKPLCFRAGPDGIAFASEIKALRSAGLAGGAGLRPEAVDAYLAFTYIPAPWTIHREVLKVPAGHVVRLRPGGGCGASPLMERYWAAPPRENLTASPREALERLDAALSRRVPGKGPAAVFLSGGLDSSLVAALLARREGREVATFSIGFSEGDLDESGSSRHVAALLGTTHREIILREIPEDLALRVVRHLDEPMADAASLPTMLLAEAASGMVQVVLTGDGADALLAGDHWFRRLRLMDRLERLPAPGRRALAAASSMGGGRRGARLGMHADLAGQPPAQRYLRIREKWTPGERERLYAPGFRREVDTTRAADTYLKAPVDWRPGESVDAAVRLDTVHGLPEGLLMKVDKMGMAHGLECRSPFLDAEWVEWVSRLRMDHLLRGGSSKHIVRQAARSLLPAGVTGRRKQGFRVPMGRWLKGPLRRLLEEAFSPELIRRQGIFDPSALSGLRTRFQEGPGSAALDGRVWQVVAFQTWWRTTVG